MSDNIGDVISSASLLLAIMTGLMGFWYTDVTRAINEKVPNLPGEKKVLRRKISPVFWAKALPLAIWSSIIALIFAWRSVGILVSAFELLDSTWVFNDLKAAFVATEALMLTLALVTIHLAWRLGRKCVLLGRG